VNQPNLPPRRLEPFKLVSSYIPRGDQPNAIKELNERLSTGVQFQTLRGITGSGKTFTMANVIRDQGRPALIIAPNKTLAAQLYAEFREFFPNNQVRYFVSYYDYYQPEAYIPSTDTYIEKDSAINEEIDKMRHAATKALLESTDAIIVASVSCIYGLGAPEEYFKAMLYVEQGEQLNRKAMLRTLVQMQYVRSDNDFYRGTFRVRGESIDVFPSDQDARAIRFLFFGDEVEEIHEIDGITGTVMRKLSSAAVYPVSHFVTAREKVVAAAASIRTELEARLVELRSAGKTSEAQRLEQRTMYDIELLFEVGFCPGIENYSRHLDQRAPGSPPSTLLDYFPKGFLLFIDESHVTVPQIGAMARGDRARKQTLVDYGFRLPSALDNRPLMGEEFWERAGQTIFVSATPADFELSRSGVAVVEQINRPTGLLDPEVFVRPALHQVDDLLNEAREVVDRGGRVLVTTLTKRMAEDLTSYLQGIGIRSRYLHADINTVERVEILRGLRRGDFDLLVGINLLREGLDLVEVELVAILDADKEGFLRSERSLIQTMGRAARNIRGRVILYADRETDSIRRALREAERRRLIQAAYNTEHGIVPQSAQRGIEGALTTVVSELVDPETGEIVTLDEPIPADPKAQQKLIESLKAEMLEAAAKREYERAAELRDKVNRLQRSLLV
jgi:excinuclease ABC subunit B